MQWRIPSRRPRPTDLQKRFRSILILPAMTNVFFWSKVNLSGSGLVDQWRDQLEFSGRSAYPLGEYPAEFSQVGCFFAASPLSFNDR